MYRTMQKEVYEFISKKTNDPIIEWRTCTVSWEEFAIFQSDKEFYDKISPTFDGQTFQIPFPTLCPQERQKRRRHRRNDRTLYKTTCAHSSQSIISMYAPDKPYVVYEHNIWRGDSWSGWDYGKKIDFSTSFHAQFDKLLKSVPLPSLVNANSENADYVNQTANIKNSYLITSCCDCEQCYYSFRLFHCEDCIDGLIMNQCQQCYECIDARKSYACFFSQNILECRDSMFLFDCHGCHDCFLCWNLRGTSFCIENIQYTEHEYNEKIKTYRDRVWSSIELTKLKKHFKDLISKKAIHHANYMVNCEASFGWYLHNCKRTIFCHEWAELEDVKYSLLVDRATDCMDINNNDWGSLQYEACTAWLESHNILFCVDAWPATTNQLYCFFCPWSRDCFWCVGLKNQQYCIFNKQYDKEEYEKEVAKIIIHMQETGEWGEFFDPKYSPFSYNESSAYDYFPMIKKEAINYWYTWYVKNESSNENLVIVTLPDHIDDYYENWKIVLQCELSEKSFRLLPQEIAFYRHHRIALPRMHPFERHHERVSLKPTKNYHLRTCDKTWEEMLSVYPQDVSFKVYSEEAYQQEIYG